MFPSVPAFCYCNRLPEINNLKRGNSYLSHRFIDSVHVHLAPSLPCFGSGARQSIMVGSNSWSRKMARERNGTFPVTQFPPVRPFPYKVYNSSQQARTKPATHEPLGTFKIQATARLLWYTPVIPAFRRHR
jgi:hypothetical protein